MTDPMPLAEELIAFVRLVGGEVVDRPLDQEGIRPPDSFEFAYGAWAQRIMVSLDDLESTHERLTPGEKINLERRLKDSTGVEVERSDWYPEPIR